MNNRKKVIDRTVLVTKTLLTGLGMEQSTTPEGDWPERKLYVRV